MHSFRFIVLVLFLGVVPLSRAADIRVRSLTSTATSAASDDYTILDGTTNGTRKILGNTLVTSVVNPYFADPSTNASFSASAWRTDLALVPGTNFLAYPTGTPTGSKFLRDDNSWQSITGGGDALVASPLSQFASTTSSQLAGVISNETGSGVLVFNDSPTFITPALGTPSSGTLTNATGLPIATGVSGLGTGVATFLATPSSANLASAVTGETGTGALVFADAPTLSAPVLGVATATSYSSTRQAHSAMGATETFDRANGEVHEGTLDANLTVTLSGWAASGKYSSMLIGLLQDGTGGRTVTWPAAVVAAPTVTATADTITWVSLWTTDGGTTVYAVSTATSGSGLASGDIDTSAELRAILTDETGSGAAVFATSPTLTTPNLGTPSALTLTNATGLPVAGITASTSTALGVGSVELGHATDTTVARASAGDISVEGNRVFRVGGSFTGLPDVWVIPIGDETTAITTGTAKVTFRAPYAATVTAVRASLTTVSSSGTPTFDINEGGTTILSTKLTVDASEKTSTTAAAAAVISDTALADDAEITIDVDTAGTSAAGAKISIYVTRG